MNLFLLGGVLALSFIIGFLIRGSELAKAKRKIISLETEMVSNHAEILNLQKENVEMEKKLKSLSIPVIPLTAQKEEKNNESKRVASQAVKSQSHT